MIFFHSSNKLLVLDSMHTVSQLHTNHKASLLTIAPMAESNLESIIKNGESDYLTSDSEVKPILSLTSYPKKDKECNEDIQ